jgi:drug/metabolite transporter (DMT)-like permease
MDIKYSYLPLIGSEIALSLYPQLIKLVPTTIETQVAVRCITYSILAIIGYYISSSYSDSDKKIKSLPFMNYLSIGLCMGIVNIIHIISSYMCFNILSSGVSYSIFYIYPIFNLIGRTLFYNENIEIINYIYIIIAIIGVYLIYKKEYIENSIQTTTYTTPDTTTSDTTTYTFMSIFNTKNKNIGIISGIVSALSESLIYFMVKGDTNNISPYIQLLKTYLLGGILSIIYLIQNVKYIDLDYHYWITLILFNTIIGFVGYLVRFMMISHLSTLLFNSLIFISVICSYFWGYLLNNESIHINNIAGTLLILWSIFQINKK